ncbi:MAG: hypothetical protein V2A55_03610 [Candidatus Jorgensenbacteria bacterium]
MVIVVVFLVAGQSDKSPAETSIPQGASVTKTVVLTDSGFSPVSLSVRVGDTVVFENRSSTDFWPTSAMHPTHKVYPGSDIEKCGTAEESKIFDACRAIPAGGSWFFTFNEAGSWDYHDHLDAKNFGKIIVE